MSNTLSKFVPFKQCPNLDKSDEYKKCLCEICQDDLMENMCNKLHFDKLKLTLHNANITDEFAVETLKKFCAFCNEFYQDAVKPLLDVDGIPGPEFSTSLICGRDLKSELTTLRDIIDFQDLLKYHCESYSSEHIHNLAKIKRFFYDMYISSLSLFFTSTKE